MAFGTRTLGRLSSYALDWDWDTLASMAPRKLKRLDGRDTAIDVSLDFHLCFLQKLEHPV